MVRSLVLVSLLVGCGSGSRDLSSDYRLPQTNLASPAEQVGFARDAVFLGDRVAVGAPEAGSGRVHLYDVASARLLTTLTSPRPRADGRFGESVAAFGDHLLVGAPGEGRAYLFQLSLGVALRAYSDEARGFGASVLAVNGEVWVGGDASIHRFEPFGQRLGVVARPGRALARVGELVAAGEPAARRVHLVDPASGAVVRVVESDSSGFGASVGTADGALLVGAPAAGRAFVVSPVDGSVLLTLEQPEPGSRFGEAVAAEGEHLLVGAADAAGQARVYIFRAGSGAFLRTLESGVPATAAVSLEASSGLALLGVEHQLAQVFDCSLGGLTAVLSAPNGTNLSRFGSAITLPTDRVVVSEPNDDGLGELIHVYERGGGFLRTLTHPVSGQPFGAALATNGVDLFVGAPRTDVPGAVDTGAVFVFDALTCQLKRTIQNPSGLADAHFGHSIAIVGSNIVVGAPGDRDLDNQPGTAFLIDPATGNTLQTFASGNPENGGGFGYSVSAVANEVIVGAPFELNVDGRAYLFQDDGTLMETYATGNPQGMFGYSMVSENDGSHWVGAPGDEGAIGGTAVGRVHIVAGFAPQPIQAIESRNAIDNGNFGAALAISASFIAIGAPGEPIEPEQAGGGASGQEARGVVHLIDRGTRTRSQRFVSPPSTLGGRFGTAVALEEPPGGGGRILGAGAPLDDLGVPGAGGAYLFNLEARVAFTSFAPADNAEYGRALAPLLPGRVIIGAPRDEANQGAVYVQHVVDTGNLLRISNPNASVGALFGISVAGVTGDVLAGAPGDEQAHLFDLNGNLLRTFDSPAVGVGLFGITVAAVGDLCVIGAPALDASAGRVFVFAKDGTLVATIVSPNATSTGDFGFSLAAAGNDILIGAPGEAAASGRAYLFDVNGNFLRDFVPPVDGFSTAFGWAVSGFGQQVLVSEPFDGAGAVHRYDRVGVLPLFTHRLPNGAPFDASSYGSSLADIEGRLLVGAESASGPGYAFVVESDDTLVAVLRSGNPQNGGSLGTAVAVVDGLPVVGAPQEDVNPDDAGRVYVYRNSLQGSQPPPTGGGPINLSSPNAILDGDFGHAVGFSGTNVFVTAPGEDNGAGRFYVYAGGNDVPSASMNSPNRVANGGAYGFSLGVNSTMAAVGAPGETATQAGAGRVYLYNALSLGLMLTFVSTNPELDGGFGRSVAVSSANVAVGAPFEATFEPEAGRVYYFDCAVTTPLVVMESPNGFFGGFFGAAVLTRGFDVFVGAPGEFGGQGRVYRFNGLTGQLLATYQSATPLNGGAFGSALAFFGPYLLVGAPGEEDATQVAGGRVHVVDLATGNVASSFVSNNVEQDGRFGFALTSDAANVWVGAPGENNARGMVYRGHPMTGLAATIQSPLAEDGGEFGRALAALAGNLLVGAPLEDAPVVNAGRAYVNPAEAPG